MVFPANGAIKVKVSSEIQDPSPFGSAQGLIFAFRIDEEDAAFESIYQHQKKLEHLSIKCFRTIGFNMIPTQNISWIVQENWSQETSSPVKYQIDTMNESNTNGSIALPVDIGTIGYLKNWKIAPKQKEQIARIPILDRFKMSGWYWDFPFGLLP
jgi:hypothetical protein